MFYLKISDGKEAEISIAAADAHEATNEALNALSQFACKSFPPPESVSIIVSDQDRTKVATLKLAFTIEYAEGMTM